jgi:hypothetical protein
MLMAPGAGHPNALGLLGVRDRGSFAGLDDLSRDVAELAVHALADDAQDVEGLLLVTSLLFIRMPMAVRMSRLRSSAIRRFWFSSWSMSVGVTSCS